MPLFGQFSGNRTFGRSGRFKPSPPTISNVANVGTNRPYNNGAITFTIAGAVGQPEPDFFNIWALDPLNTEIPVGSLFGTQGTIQNLLSNVQYRIKAVAVKNSVASDPVIFNTPTLVTTVPRSPVIGTATDVGTNRSIVNAAANVSFTARENGGLAQTFKVYTADNTERGTSSSSPITATGIDITSASIYTFKVKAINANGESDFSAESNGATLTSTPGGPSLVIDGTSGTQANFTFNVTQSGGKPVTSTRIYAMSNGSEIATTTISAASGTGSLTLPEITSNTFLWAQATNANGAGEFGTAGTIFPTGAPTLSVSRPNTLNATVTITNYNASFTYTVNSASGTVSRSGGTINISGTTASAFDVTVIANQGNFYINRSTTIQVPASSTPATVTNINYIYYGLGLISFSWDAVPGTVSYKTVLTGPGGLTEFTNTNGISFDGLSEGSTYSFSVEAYTGASGTGTLLATGSRNSFTFGSSTTTTTTTSAPATTTTTTTLAPATTTTTTTSAPPATTTTTTTAAPSCSGTCTAGTAGNTTNCDVLTSSCTPAGCGAGCTVTCTNYCSSAASSPGQSVTATGPCGSYTVTATFPGARAVIRCCSC